MCLFSITEHIDFATPLQEPAAEPLCNANLAASMHTLDHLSGVANRASIHYTGESQLLEVRNNNSLYYKNNSEHQGIISAALFVFFCLDSQVLQNLGKDKFLPQSFEQIGTRIAKVLEKVKLLSSSLI